MSELKYLTPKSLKETLVLISEYKNKARIIAGGTDLLAKMKKGVEIPGVLISIQGVKDLDYIKFDEKEGLKIGALTSLSNLENSPIIQSRFPILSQTAGMMASPVVRTVATIGGNICNAAPSADIVPALIVLGAKAKITEIGGEIIVPVEDLFTGPGKTVLKNGQILTEIQIPVLPTQTAAVYLKQKRREGADLAVVGVAALVTIVTDICSSTGPYNVNRITTRLGTVRLALGAVAPTPLRVKEAEAVVQGHQLSDTRLEEAGKISADLSKPISDARGSADYRKKMVAVLVPRAIKQAAEKIQLEV